MEKRQNEPIMAKATVQTCGYNIKLISRLLEGFLVMLHCIVECPELPHLWLHA